MAVAYQTKTKIENRNKSWIMAIFEAASGCLDAPAPLLSPNNLYRFPCHGNHSRFIKSSTVHLPSPLEHTHTRTEKRERGGRRQIDSKKRGKWKTIKSGRERERAGENETNWGGNGEKRKVVRVFAIGLYRKQGKWTRSNRISLVGCIGFTSSSNHTFKPCVFSN